MSAAEPDFIDVDGAKIAVRNRAGQVAPGIVWLGGYRSDTLGTKAVVLDEWAEKTGHSALRLDYSGHGESGGDFNQGTISRWLNESLTVLDKYAEGPQILVGSSMGGWIALRMAQELKKAGKSPAGIVLIAPAPDFTAELVEPSLTDKQKKDLMEQGYFEEPSEYSPNPYIYTRALIEDGRNNLVLKGIIETGCPVHILQGMQDEAVPYQHALKLVEHLPLDDVTLTLVRDGDHRLSRPQDLELLIRTVSALAERISFGD
ncbi:alpha/beta hydrolase [Brucella pseudogrignonensis]|uniref:alpha/beta hydrolase n=1 Tax=Brucella pseudogrignonensis TaxID=419475 RepID=UPI000CFA9405|nr:alpha/beta hydrolase [Brucella pseudogrignonensis]MQP39941.1 alpha/beta fold hydrolase [Ochrobactrum sp. MYb237]PQZ44448.1 alpha/beta hydrolase [Brucella pseudogrignonensis]PRA41757.1 alpha/beta hydrolase [Brucella pseudogrignonensis]PRA70816.1 alpha/beta hydrolase [Brucella pseudogrignonensis]